MQLFMLRPTRKQLPEICHQSGPMPIHDIAKINPRFMDGKLARNLDSLG
jgi:hypothetical protein